MPIDQRQLLMTCKCKWNPILGIIQKRIEKTVTQTKPCNSSIDRASSATSGGLVLLAFLWLQIIPPWMLRPSFFNGMMNFKPNRGSGWWTRRCWRPLHLEPLSQSMPKTPTFIAPKEQKKWKILNGCVWRWILDHKQKNKDFECVPTSQVSLFFTIASLYMKQ